MPDPFDFLDREYPVKIYEDSLDRFLNQKAIEFHEETQRWVERGSRPDDIDYDNSQV